MSPGFAVFVLMNNYFHDVATALILACGAAAWMLLKRVENAASGSVTAYFLVLYNKITRVFWFSIGWIIVGGIIRALTFSTFEWPNAVEKHHEAGLIAKYAIATIMMVIGAYLWIVVSRRVKKLHA